jgi:hypothetical protein
MISQEFDRFLSYLSTISISDDVKRMANLIRNYCNQLIPICLTQSQRSKKIIKIAQNEFSKASTRMAVAARNRYYPKAIQ